MDDGSEKERTEGERVRDIEEENKADSGNSQEEETEGE